MSIPYVVSTDIRLLMEEWAKNHSFTIPGREFFSALRRDFSSYLTRIFSRVEFVSEEELTEGVAELVRDSGLFPLSLDRVYYRSEPSLEINRVVTTDGIGYGWKGRPGAPEFTDQFEELRAALGEKEVVLVDDWVFSSELARIVKGRLEDVGIRVRLVVAGIGTGTGEKWLKTVGVEMRAVRVYEELIDGVCERDFYPGVPLSGRTIAEARRNVGIPYLLPSGRPWEWASIPWGLCPHFSVFCLKQTIALFEEIERRSLRAVRVSDLDRLVVWLTDRDRRFIDLLKKEKGGLMRATDLEG